MRKTAIRGMALLAALLALGFSALGETRLMVVSDTHYMAPELYEGSELFLKALRAGDGKLTQHSELLMDALKGEALRLRPDALILTGDLSFNGEAASHRALAERLAEIEAEGIPVWVVPGNHDINSMNPVGFSEDRWNPVEGVDAAAFSAIYADFLSPASEGANLSYAVRVSDALWVAMLDVSFYQGGAQTFGLFTAGHGAWLEDVLREAQDAGAEVITATHHSLLAHTDFLKDSFLMFGHETMQALAEKYGVRLNLSGHLHAQHIAREDGLADAALGAFCLWPHRYALVTLGDDGSLTYEAKSLGDAALPEGFMELSREWFFGIAADKTEAALAELDIPESDRKAMADYAARFNLAFFAGEYRPSDAAWREDRAYTLWLNHSDVPFWQYLNLVMNEPAGDNLRYSAD